jgi:hypothetical protein
MELERFFDNLRFPQRILRDVVETLQRSAKSPEADFMYLSASSNEGKWTFDHIEDFFDAYRTCRDASFHYQVVLKDAKGKLSFFLNLYRYGSSVTISSPVKSHIMQIFNFLEESRPSASRIIEEKENEEQEPQEMRVFIGHGRSKAWEELKNHLQDKHGYRVEAFESGERAGRAVRDIREDMLNRSCLAFLVLTGEDETADGGIRARQNVIHETGLFQGRLGFSRAIVLLEEGVETFSKIMEFSTFHLQRVPSGQRSVMYWP